MNSNFWLNPPWQQGKTPFHLGLNPVDDDPELLRSIDEGTLAHKSHLLQHRYDDVTRVTVDESQASLPLVEASPYPHHIANLALCVAPDLCVIDLLDQQRLVAGCVCSPSYWSLAEKIGLPLRDVHDTVTGMNARIGDNISRFMDQLTTDRVFQRVNWFVHGDAEGFHPTDDDQLPADPREWQLRSETQTLRRLDGRFALFTIRVDCEPLIDIGAFPESKVRLQQVLERMSDDEVEHFGGPHKHQHLQSFLKELV